IKMRIAAPARNRRKNAGHYRECPPGRDHDPTAAFGLRSFQQNACHDTVAEQNQDHRAKKFSEPGWVHEFSASVLFPIERSTHGFFPPLIEASSLVFRHCLFPYAITFT